MIRTEKVETKTFLYFSVGNKCLFAILKNKKCFDPALCASAVPEYSEIRSGFSLSLSLSLSLSRPAKMNSGMRIAESKYFFRLKSLRRTSTQSNSGIDAKKKRKKKKRPGWGWGVYRGGDDPLISNL